MKVQITITRVDDGCEPWTFTETRYDSVSLARETTQLFIDRVNDVLSHTGQVALKVKAEFVSLPEVPHAKPNPREAERLAAVDLAARKKR